MRIIFDESDSSKMSLRVVYRIAFSRPCDNNYHSVHWQISALWHLSSLSADTVLHSGLDSQKGSAPPLECDLDLGQLISQNWKSGPVGCISRAATDRRQSSTRLQCDCSVCGRVNDVPSFSMCHTAFFGSWCSSTTTSPCTARCFQEPIGRQ